MRPTATETIAVDGQSVVVPKAVLHFRQWQGQPIRDTFGGKPLVDFAGRPVFAELCVYELFRLAGWEARWVETYGAPATQPMLLVDWIDTSRAQQPQQPLPGMGVGELMPRIASHNGGTYAGCWDVLGWYGDAVLFAELKRAKKDRLQATQPQWLAAGLRAGLAPENFLLVEWDFLP